ncbi:MAG TPA: TlpA disulfide reductase family protein [Acidimicrobiia bacterium]
MRRLLVLTLLLAACTAGADMPTTTAPAPATTITTEPSTTTVATVGHDRELAPDFTLELADGDAFTLSKTDKPVYLIFWAEWCPVCNKELPVIDEIAVDYADRVDFIAPVWRSVPEMAEKKAAELMPSGAIRWGLDNEEVIFGLYGVPYQPVTILVAADGTVFDQWAGVRKPEEIRDAIEALLEVPGSRS